MQNTISVLIAFLTLFFSQISGLYLIYVYFIILPFQIIWCLFTVSILLVMQSDYTFYIDLNKFLVIKTKQNNIWWSVWLKYLNKIIVFVYLLINSIIWTLLSICLTWMVKNQETYINHILIFIEIKTLIIRQVETLVYL